MKHLLVGLSLVLGVMFITPTPVAHAWSWSSFFGGKSSKDRGSKRYKVRNYKKSWDAPSVRRGGRSVPELDPSAAGGALVLLLGGVAYVMSRREEDDAA